MKKAMAKGRPHAEESQSDVKRVRKPERCHTRGNEPHFKITYGGTPCIITIT